MSNALPLLGSTLVLAVMVAASYTFAVSVSAASTGSTRRLQAARFGAYGAVALIGLAVSCLAYAFLTHDFALRVVAHSSDRSMPTIYLLAALWGGQAGSLLLWLFILGLYVGACVWSLGKKHVELQPYVIATLMVVVVFFCVLLTFAANPFAAATTVGPERLDGEGLNPLLQNIHMLVHPPCLYLGFVGCTVPFAFAIAALATGRLDTEWIVACRKFTLFALLFLALGNILGMAWAYEMLGWGGYWAWDPVQNAAFMPLLALVAFVHSVMMQERRGTLKVWNVFLPCVTFVMTIVGTFLNRSGAVASVHSYAQSSIGYYFLPFIGFLVALSATLITRRWRALRGMAKARPPMASSSRELVFELSNLLLVGIMLLILAMTLFPIVSDVLLRESVTVGPSFYGAWMQPLGLTVFFLMGAGTLAPWKTTSSRKKVIAPALAALVVGTLHVLTGRRLGFPADTITSVVALSLCAFNLVVIVQELVVLYRDGFRILWLAGMRRRYGGYIVHLGIVLMFFGFMGKSWDFDRQTTLEPGQTYEAEGRTLQYVGTRTVVEDSKRKILADVKVFRDGKEVGKVSPAKVIYKTMADSPVTEPAMLHSLRDDLYLVVGAINPETQRASLQIRINPLVGWIWFGAIFLVLGSIVSMWPERAADESTLWRWARGAATVIASVTLGVVLALLPVAS